MRLTMSAEKGSGAWRRGLGQKLTVRRSLPKPKVTTEIMNVNTVLGTLRASCFRFVQGS